MITHVTYEEAQFQDGAAAEAAIDIATAAGWTVSDYSVGRKARVTVLFRMDAECLTPDSVHGNPQLPAFEPARGSSRAMTAGWLQKVKAPLRKFGHSLSAAPLSALSERHTRRWG